MTLEEAQGIVDCYLEEVQVIRGEGTALKMTDDLRWITLSDNCVLSLFHEIGHAVDATRDVSRMRRSYDIYHATLPDSVKTGAIDKVIRYEASAWRWAKNNIGRPLTVEEREIILSHYGSYLARKEELRERNQQSNQAGQAARLGG